MVLHGANGTTRNHDLVLRGSPSDGFYLHDRVTGTLVAGPLFRFDEMLDAAHAAGATELWRQSTDERGRPLGDLFKLPHRIQRSVRAKR